MKFGCYDVIQKKQHNLGTNTYNILHLDTKYGNKRVSCSIKATQHNIET